jgi:predicted ribosome quality control (RQC) complex YloA/Tae2 family protein
MNIKHKASYEDMQATQLEVQDRLEKELAKAYAKIQKLETQIAAEARRAARYPMRGA